MHARITVGLVRRFNGRGLQNSIANQRISREHNSCSKSNISCVKEKQLLDLGNQKPAKPFSGKTTESFSSRNGNAASSRSRRKLGSSRKGLMTVAQEAETFVGVIRRCLTTQYARVFGALRRGPIISSRNAALLGNGSFVIVTISFMCTDIFSLRVLNVVAGVMMFAFNALGMERPLWMNLRWGGLLLVINIAQLGYLQTQSRSGILPDREAYVYKKCFANILSEGEFLRLSRMAEWHILSRGSRFAIQGMPNEFVYFIYDGMAEVEHNDVNIAEMGEGSWVGERGFLDSMVQAINRSGTSRTAASFATATVCSEKALALRWRRDELLSLLERNNTLRNGVTLSMTYDLIDKLGSQSSRAVGLPGLPHDGYNVEKGSQNNKQIGGDQSGRIGARHDTISTTGEVDSDKRRASSSPVAQLASAVSVMWRGHMDGSADDAEKSDASGFNRQVDDARLGYVHSRSRTSQGVSTL